MDALECRSVLDRVKKQLGQINYNSDLNKIYKNLEQMVSTISITEVDCRRTRQYAKLEEPIKTFQESVDRLEKLILIAKLID
jgi:cob(I)alamin adenosyltransferase